MAGDQASSDYVAFLPMPWLLLGLYAVHKKAPGALGLAGALLYGVAFTYFAHSTLYALAEHIPTYEALWLRLENRMLKLLALTLSVRLRARNYELKLLLLLSQRCLAFCFLLLFAMSWLTARPLLLLSFILC